MMSLSNALLVVGLSALLFFGSIVWVYIMARMVGRAVVRSCQDFQKDQSTAERHEHGTTK